MAVDFCRHFVVKAMYSLRHRSPCRLTQGVMSMTGTARLPCPAVYSVPVPGRRQNRPDPVNGAAVYIAWPCLRRGARPAC